MAKYDTNKTNLEKRAELLMDLNKYDMFSPEWERHMTEIERLQDLHQDNAKYEGVYKNTETGFNTADYTMQPDNKLANKFYEDHMDNYPQLDLSKAEATKSLSEAMDQPYDESGITQYDLISMDIEDNAGLITDMDPKADWTRQVANELDDSLAVLHGAGQAKYDRVMDYGLNELHDFDTYAKNHGVKVPDRKIDRALALENKGMPNNQSNFEVKGIDDAPKTDNMHDDFQLG